MREALLKGSESLLLSWNQKEFEDFISGKLTFERKLEKNTHDFEKLMFRDPKKEDPSSFKLFIRKRFFKFK